MLPKTSTVLLLAAIAALSGCDSPSGPPTSSMPWDRIDGRIAYSYHEDDQPGFRIDVLDGDAQRIRHITTNGGTALDWSPDGSQLVFHHIGAELLRYRLYTIDVTASSVRRLVLPPPDRYAHRSDPAWSTDGRVAYLDMGSSGLNARREVWVGEEALFSSRELEPEPFSSPAWSPDGRHLVVAMRSMATDDVSLYRIALSDGSFEPLLIAGDGEWLIEPAYSPDGTGVLFTRLSVGDPALPGGIWTMRADGSGQIRLTTGGGGAWSPDGTRIAFVRAGQVHLMDAAGTNVIALPIHGVSDVAWAR